MEWEIKKALFNIGSLKAPGSDGFPALIYKNNWEVMKSKLCDFIWSCWRNPNLIKECNNTLLVLVPKINNPEFINQFRPIALCNVSYKVITKIMVDRIKPYLNDRIAVHQSSFIPGRKIQDNILIAKEMIHIMKKMKGKKQFMAIKIDFEKAYDRLNWEFIKKRLQNFKFPEHFINLIMNCIQSVNYSVIWNGNRTEEFTPIRGLRQGDPLSPYLFVIAMDALSYLIEEQVQNGGWKAIRVGREGPDISHLMFADNLLLFTEATMEQITRVIEVLEAFCNVSGLKINREKSSIIFSKKTQPNTREEITKLTRFREERDLGRYLGAMITNNRKGKENYKDMLGRMQNKLKGWKGKCLSLAGRLTLAQSVLSPALNFNMQHERIPRGICQEVEKIQRNFIWGEDNNQRKMHLIGWKTLCQPKHEGGLGFRQLTTVNDAFLLKILWQAKENPEALWVKVLRHKYCNGGSLNNPINVKTTDSPLWKELMKLWPMFQNFSTYYIGNGLSTLFWKHQWVKEEDCLLDLALNPDSIDPDSFVWEWTNPNGDWDIDKLHQNLPPNIVEKIIDIPAPQAELEDDRIGWKLSQDGDFSLNATYKSLRNWSKERNTIWEKVWSWKGPQRAKVFLWTAMHRRIMTNQRKAKIFGGTGNCSLCNSGIEDTLHALRNCPKASTIWVNLLKSNEIPGFFQSNWEDWIGVNLHKQLGKNDNLNWLDTFITTCWRIWYWRNKEMHDTSYNRPRQPHQEIYKQVQDIKEALEKDYLVGKRIGRTERNIGWHPPPKGWIKLNTDGTAQGNPVVTGCGGLLRNEEGNWIAGFTHRIGDGTAFLAELWGVKNGLKLAWTMGFKRVVVEIDSAAVVSLLNGGKKLESHPNANVREINDMRRKDWNIFFVQNYRESNRCADYLAKMSLKIEPNFVFWDMPPPEVVRILNEDNRGVTLPRLVCN
ncbi:hypothetical protein AHAS_Ahas18G0040900 [Arachis hypogaea]